MVAVAAILGLAFSAITGVTGSGWFDRTFSDLPQVPAFVAFADHSLPPAADNSEGGWTLEAAYPRLQFESPMAVKSEPGSARVWVAERAGRLWHFADEDDTAARNLALDIRARTWDGTDSGLLDFTFHPEFAEGQRWLFAAYIAGTGSQPDDRRFRISKFEIGSDGRLDAEEEVILIDQIAPVDQHRGGALAFGNDGMLYISVGDLGSPSRVQRLRQTFRGCVLRIDVDSDPERSEPLGDRLVDRSEGLWTGSYGIPHDNPQWLPEDRRHLPEYFAAGLRNPHRIAVDPGSGAMLAADVGSNDSSSREEVNLIVAGGNYGWPFREGDGWLKPQPGVIVGKLTDPLFDYGHDEGDRCVIGGLFYRGDRWLSLRGHYVYGDHSSGRLWAQRWTGDGLAEERIALGRLKGVVGFGTSPRGDVLCVSLLEKRLHRIVPNERHQRRPLPSRLSDTGLLTMGGSGQLKPHPGLVEYTITSPAWHDGAEATRWIGVPTNGWRNFHHEQIQNGAGTEALELPIGSVVMKHLGFVDSGPEREGGQRRHIETQIIVRGEHGHYGAAYRWNEEQTDADLVADGLYRTIEVEDSVPGDRSSTAGQPWTHHGVRACAVCHREKDGYLLGLSTRQLAGPPPGQLTGSQLGRWQASGLLEGLNGESLPALADAPSIDDVEAPPAVRLRAWLDVNCSHCHQNDRSNRTTFDLRFAHSNDWFEVLTATPSVTDPTGQRPLIVSGSPEDSMFWQRIRSTGGDAMPPIGRHRADERMVNLLGQFIAAQPPVQGAGAVASLAEDTAIEP